MSVQESAGMVRALKRTGTSSSTRSMWRSLLVVAILSLHRCIHGGGYDGCKLLPCYSELSWKLLPLYVEIVSNPVAQQQEESVVSIGRTALGKD